MKIWFTCTAREFQSACVRGYFGEEWDEPLGEDLWLKDQLKQRLPGFQGPPLFCMDTNPGEAFHNCESSHVIEAEIPEDRVLHFFWSGFMLHASAGMFLAMNAEETAAADTTPPDDATVLASWDRMFTHVTELEEYLGAEFYRYVTDRVLFEDVTDILKIVVPPGRSH